MLSTMMMNISTPIIAFFLPGGMPGLAELLILGFVVLLLFGKRLPDLMGSLGRSIVEFKKGARELEGPESRESEPTGKPES